MGTFYGTRAALPVFRAARARPPDFRLVDRRQARHPADERLQRDEGRAGGLRGVAAVRVLRHRHSHQRRLSSVDDDRIPGGDGAGLWPPVSGLGPKQPVEDVAARDRAMHPAAGGRGVSARHVARARDPECRSRRHSPIGWCGSTAGAASSSPPHRILRDRARDEHRGGNDIADLVQAPRRARAGGRWLGARSAPRPNRQGRRRRGLRPRRRRS